MKHKLAAVFIAVLLTAANALFAGDNRFTLSGSIGAGALGMVSDAKDGAKLQEYRDLSDNAAGSVYLKGRSRSFHMDVFGENLGRDDMRMEMKGGVYGRFNFHVYSDWLTHNFGFGPHGARTPYTDPSSHNLSLFSTTPSALLNSQTPPWNSFKFSIDRKVTGGSFEYSGSGRWYFLLGGSQVSQSGINKVDAAALGTSPGNGFIDLPYPVDYMTRTGSAEGGYQNPRGHFSVVFSSSVFDNDNELLNFQNPFFGFGMDAATFAPDNHYAQISASGMLRQLPLHATLSGRIAYDRGTDQVKMIDAILNTSGSAALTSTAPSHATFYGQVENVTVNLSYAMEPARLLDARLYYNYSRRRNSSTDISFDVPLNTAGMVCFEAGTTSSNNINAACAGDRYSYTKQNPGLEAGYRLSRHNRIIAGFDYMNIDRNRFDANRTSEKKVFLQWANTTLDSLSMRIKYQFLHRRSDFKTDNAGYDANSPFFLERFNRSFDVADLNQHLMKAQADWSPVKLLDLGFEAYYKYNNYQNLVLGRNDDERKEFFGSVSFGDPETFRITLFGDAEFIQYNAHHRTVNFSACPGNAPNCFDPRTAPTINAFNWKSRLKDKNWTVELAADWLLSARWRFISSAMIAETKGAVDFQSQTLTNQDPAARLFPIMSYDNTRRWAVTPHFVYSPAQRTELTLGYSFERFAFRDDQYEGYTYTIGSGTTASYLAGIYAFPDYDAHILYGIVRVKF